MFSKLRRSFGSYFLYYIFSTDFLCLFDLPMLVYTSSFHDTISVRFSYTFYLVNLNTTLTGFVGIIR